MRVVCVGGGPSGLYFSMLAKKRNPSWEVSILERNAPGETFGWGVVFSDETLAYLGEADPESEHLIKQSFAHWDAVDIYFQGTWTHSGGHGFSGISRRKLLEILRVRAENVGVQITHGVAVTDLDAIRSADLIVASDGLHSGVRKQHEAHFAPTLDVRKAKYIWLGTSRLFDAFTFLFEEYAGGVFQVHAYRFDTEMSTFIVETDVDTWKRAGLDQMPVEAQLALLEQIFAKHLGGHKLRSNRSAWIQFPTLRCQRWSYENVVLLGDAAHTAHFSIGSGTKMAMEDAIALDLALFQHGDIPTALLRYEQERRLTVEKTQAAAQDSLQFFENTKRYMHFTPEAFGFRLMTRTKKIGYDNLKLRDTTYVESVREAYQRALGAEARPAAPPMFAPFALRSMTLANRVVLSPMCMYSAINGTPGDFHLVHLGTRAIGGAGLIVTEMTTVAEDARITLGCTGMYTSEHVDAWRRITAFVHSQSKAKICLQLGHAGRKGATRLMWEGMDQPLEHGGWPLISASALPYYPHSAVPKAMDRADMDRVLHEYERATRYAIEADFDMIEIHMAHGYLLASFISPLTNHRTDAYGGSLEARMRFPLEVFDAVRRIWSAERPMSVRISATDWQDSGTTEDDALCIAALLKEHGCDLADISTGQTTPESKPRLYGRMYQTPFSDQIRNDVRMPTLAVGNITTADQVNTILAAGRADLVALGRNHLRDPFFTLHAAEEAGFDDLSWPKPYSVVYPPARKA